MDRAFDEGEIAQPLTSRKLHEAPNGTWRSLDGFSCSCTSQPIRYRLRPRLRRLVCTQQFLPSNLSPSMATFVHCGNRALMPNYYGFIHFTNAQRNTAIGNVISDRYAQWRSLIRKMFIIFHPRRNRKTTLMQHYFWRPYSSRKVT